MQLSDASLWRTQAYINGKWVDARNGDVRSVHNPVDNSELANIAACGTADAELAIDAAAAAQVAWRALAAKQRSDYLYKLYALMMEHQEDLARIMTLEQGKPLAESRGEIAYGANFIQWFAEEAKRVYGDTIPGPDANTRLVVVKEPVGVVGCITPWNFPNAMLARKIGPALAVGCTVVCKPANETPLSAFAIAELCHRAGIPPGVVNVLAGHTAEIGAQITGNPKVRKVTFTGSTEVGKQLIQECSTTVKRTSMELGGNAPFLVFDDADLDAAVAGAMASKYRNAGQTCVCANRLLVQAGVYDEFAHKLSAKVRKLKVGDGLGNGTDIGPLINPGAADDVLAMIADAQQAGAEVMVGGGQPAAQGNFVEPTVLTQVTPKMRVFREEIFGPVAPLIRFETEEEGIALANDTEFGLASYFYSRDIGRVWRVADRLEYGIVGINEGAISNEMAPFGGMKESGSGREGSKYGTDEYLEIKYLCMGGLGE